MGAGPPKPIVGGMTTTTLRPSAAAIAAATPPDRNRYVDALRLFAITMVVIGHWLIAVVWRDGDGLHAASALALEPGTQWLTWVFQVMPLFFVVGGYANAVAWRRAAERGTGFAEWARGRARRLLRPAVPVFAVWVPLTVVLGALGVDGDLLRLATQAVIVPTWFLAAYLVIVALVPVSHALHRRFGAWVPAVLLVLAAAVDGAHLAGVPVVGYLNYVLVWGAVHQAGYLWLDGRLPRRVPAALAVAALGLVALAALVGLAGYPVSMVGFDGATRTNTGPPTIALAALGTAQLGLVLALRGPAERLLARAPVWAAVVRAGAVTMTVYLWHMTALVATAAAVVATGLWRGGTLDATWWATRPLWFALLGAVLVALVAVFGRFERAGQPRHSSAPLRAALGVAATTAGLALLVLDGLHDPTGPAGLPLARLALLTAGLAGLGVLSRPRTLVPDGR